MQHPNFDLESAPSYVSLSYTWGEPSPTHTILINRMRFKVRENLYQFLFHFSSDRANNQYLWIDQISINQNRVKERNHQVRLMSEIFRNCQFVISWLGCHPPIVEAAREFHLTKRIESLQPLLFSPYFTRLWIVQEILLARDVQIMCKDIWISKTSMQDLAESCSWAHMPNVPLSLFTEGGKDYEFMNTSAYSEHLLSRDIYSSNLKTCLERYSENKCVDPRDKVYGLLGLVETEDDNVYSSFIHIDYGQSVEAVFFDAVIAVASECRHNMLLQNGYEPSHCQEKVNKLIMLLGKNMNISDHYKQRLRCLLQWQDQMEFWQLSTSSFKEKCKVLREVYLNNGLHLAMYFKYGITS